LISSLKLRPWKNPSPTGGKSQRIQGDDPRWEGPLKGEDHFSDALFGFWGYTNNLVNV